MLAVAYIVVKQADWPLTRWIDFALAMAMGLWFS
jgi:hypothetical protein